MLKEFSDVEADSAWQYMQAIQFADNPQLRLTLFNNVLEERNHADIFFQLHQTFKTANVSGNSKRRQPLINSVEEISDFLAVVHVGESSVHEKFVRYANKAQNKKISEAFQRISEDEEGHGSETLDHLKIITGDNKKAGRKVAKAKIKQHIETFGRHSTKIGDVIFSSLLALVFFAFGLIARLGSKPIGN